MDFKCQDWPNDYNFIQQVLYMSEKVQNSKKDENSSFFNCMLAVGLVVIFLLNGSIFREMQMMYTINLFVTLIITLYIGKYFDNEGVDNVASFVKFIFFTMSHHFIDKLILCFRINEVNNPLCLPD